MLKTCHICSFEFEAKANNQKSCSNVCRDKWYFIRKQKRQDAQPYLTKICCFCNNQFQYKERKDRERNFCNRSCASKFYTANGTYDGWQLAGVLASVEPKVNVQCAACGADVEVTVFHAEKYQRENMQICCDTKCRVKYTRQKNIGITWKQTEEAKVKQKETLLKNHGVTNAYALAKHRANTKPQQEVFAFVKSCYNFKWEDEKKLKFAHKRGGWYHVDIFCKKLNLIIEFNGDYWHCNPKFYAADYFHKKKQKTAAQIWEEDKNRLQNLIDLGYQVIMIWENDLKITPWKQNLTDKIDEIRSKYI